MQFRLRHPRYPEIKALYGYDPDRGFWVCVVERVVDDVQDPETGRFVQVEEDWVRDEYDASCAGYCDADPLLGALTLLAEQGFFPMDDLLEALEIP